MKTYKCALALVIICLVGCGPKNSVRNKQTSKSRLDFISFGNDQSTTLKAMRSSEFRLCINDQGYSGDMTKMKETALIGLLSWYKAIRQIDPAIKNNIKFDCNNSHVDINVQDGDGRSSTSGNSITLLASNGDGSILHEYGHGFAGLADTYDTGTGQAGACVQGQPKSVMCWGQYGKHDSTGRALLYEDDIAGIQANYIAEFPEFASAKPDKSIDATATLDLKNPWPDAGGGVGGGSTADLFAMFGDSASPSAADIYVSTPSDTQSVAICLGNATACGATGAKTYYTASVTMAGITDRLVFKSIQVPMTANTYISFIVTNKAGARTVARTIMVKAKS